MHRADTIYKYTTQSQYPDTNQLWLYPLNAEGLSDETTISNCNTFGMVRQGLEPATSRLRYERADHYSILNYILQKPR